MSKKKKTAEFSKMDLVMIIVIIAAIASLAALLMVFGNIITRGNATPTPSGDRELTMEELGWHDFQSYFSKGLDENGKVSGIDVKEYVTLPELASLELPENCTIEQWKDALLAQSTVTVYEPLFDALKERYLFYANYMYEYQEENYYNYNGEHKYESIYEAYGTTEEGFEQYIEEQTLKETKLVLIVQAIFEERGLTVTHEHVLQWLSENNYTADDEKGIVFQHGQPYVNRMAMQYAVWNSFGEN